MGPWEPSCTPKGSPPGECPESWCVSHPDVVQDIAEAYVAAGSDIVETNSFGGSRFKLKRYGLADQVAEFNRAAAALAKAGQSGDKGYVAASVGPTGHIVEDEGGDVTPEQLYEAFKEQVIALAEGGADAICIETMSSLAEAVQAIKAAKENTAPPGDLHLHLRSRSEGLPHHDGREARPRGAGSGRRWSRHRRRQLRQRYRQHDRDHATDARRRCPTTPILIHANAGAPVVEDGKTVFKETPEYMASRVRELIEAGANIIGGCCGTNPSHIVAIAAAVKAFAAGA